MVQAESTVSKGKATSKKGGWIKKIPPEVLFSPGGMILLFYAIIMEAIDILPLGGADTLTYELVLQIIFVALVAVVLKTPILELLKTMILPFLVELVPFLSDIIPSFLIWILKMIM